MKNKNNRQFKFSARIKRTCLNISCYRTTTEISECAQLHIVWCIPIIPIPKNCINIIIIIKKKLNCYNPYYSIWIYILLSNNKPNLKNICIFFFKILGKTRRTFNHGPYARTRVSIRSFRE